MSEQTAALIGPPGPPRPAGPAAAAPATAARDGLVGREHELADLSRARQGACQGAGGVVWLEGDGGVGKTRLVEELQAAAAPSAPGSAVVAGATAAGPGRAAPFAVWTDALGDVVAATGAPDNGPAWAGQLVRILPSLAAPPGQHRVPAGADPALEQVQLCEAVVQFLGWAARRGPLLLTLEDLHLADPASVQLTAYAGRRLARLPVLLVLTRRMLPPRQDLDAVTGMLATRRALIATLSLGPLTAAQTRALVSATADIPAAGPFLTPAPGGPQWRWAMRR